MTTLEEIARRAGVSSMTVSRVLRNHRGVSPSTKARVLEAAAALGYRPDPLMNAFLQRLRYKRSSSDVTVIAYLTTYAAESPMAAYPYIRRLREGVRRRAEARGYQMEEFNIPALGGSVKRIEQILAARGIRGVVVAPLAKRGRLQMDFSGLSSAAIGSTLYYPRLHRTKADHALNMQITWRELRRRGYRKVGLVLDRDSVARTEYLAEAVVLECQRRAEKQDRIPSLILPRFEKAPVVRWCKRWRPEAIVTVNYAIVDWVSEVPHRPKVVNMASLDEDGCDFGIDQFHDEIAGSAVDLVVEQLMANQVGIPEWPKVVNIPGRWIEKTSQVTL